MEMDNPLMPYLEEYKKRMKARRLAEATQKLTVITILDLIRMIFDGPFDSALERIHEYLGCLKPSTHSRKVIQFRSFLRLCPEPYRSLASDHQMPIPRIPQKKLDLITQEEFTKLLAELQKTRHGYRNTLIVLLAIQMGLRSAEILSLTPESIQGSWLKIKRKGSNEQLLPLSAPLQGRIYRYIQMINPNPTDRLFPITPLNFRYILNAAAKKAGIKKKVHPHILRHSFATQMVMNGVALPCLKEFLGHSNIQTTERYLHITAQHLKDQESKMPYQF